MFFYLCFSHAVSANDVAVRQKYLKMITNSEIKIVVDQKELWNKKLIASTAVVDRGTQEPMAEFKVTWFVNGKAHGNQAELSMDLANLPKVLNVTVLAALPLPEFHTVSTRLFQLQTSKSFISKML